MFILELPLRDYADRIVEKRIVHAIYMLYGTVILGAFVIQTKPEAIAAFDLQFEFHILFQLHFKKASAAIRGTEKPATVPFGDNDLFQREACIVQVLQANLADIGQQVRAATGIDKFRVKLFVRDLFLSFPFLPLRFGKRP